MTMIRSSLIPSLCALVLGAASLSLSAAPESSSGAEVRAATAPVQAGKLIPSSELDAAWLAKARKAYPLKQCLVSDEDLGSMGKSPEYAYRVAGKPDRLVIFCCDSCQDDFLAEPAKYLAKVRKTGGGKPAQSGKEHAH